MTAYQVLGRGEGALKRSNGLECVSEAFKPWPCLRQNPIFSLQFYYFFLRQFFFLIQYYIPTGQTVIQGNLGSFKLGFFTTLRRNSLYEHSDLNMKYMIQAMKKFTRWLQFKRQLIIKLFCPLYKGK